MSSAFIAIHFFPDQSTKPGLIELIMIFYFSDQMDTFLSLSYFVSLEQMTLSRNSFTFKKKMFSWSLPYLLDQTSLASPVPLHTLLIFFLISHNSLYA